MTKLIELYRCDICNNLVEVLNAGVGELVCCNQPMKLLVEQGINSAYNEKHVPCIDYFEDEGIEIRVGAQPHPMEDEHRIMFIQGISHDKKYIKTKFLSVNEKPMLKIKCNCEDIHARDYCNIHGLWGGDGGND